MASHLAVMAAVAVVMGVLVACLAIPFAGLVGVAAKDVSAGMVNLPESLEAKDLSQKTRIYDVNGNLIASLYDQNRINVPLELDLAADGQGDRRDRGLPLLPARRPRPARARSAPSSPTRPTAASVQGGSSITQQMVKQTLLYQAETDEERAAATEETYARKIRELRYAIAFEKNYSKDWILERYLNIAYFGDGAFGVQSAARHFFSKNAKDLNLLESATLAGLVKNPVGYDPVDNPERAESRRNVVLDRMAQLGVLTAEEGRAAQGASRWRRRSTSRRRPTAASSRARRSSATTSSTTCSRTRRSATRPRSAARALKNGGLTIKTTIDLDMQKAADDAVACPRLPDRPGHRRPGDGRARHRRRPSAGAVAADGQGQGGRRDLPQLHRPQEVRRRQRLPGRIDVQGLRPRRRHQPGHPAQHPDPLAADDALRRRGLRDLRRPLRRRRRGLGPGELHRRRHLRPLLRHPELGEHLLRPARDPAPGMCEPLELAADMGVKVPPGADRCRRGSSASPTPTR